MSKTTRQLWREEFSYTGFCILCGNTGMIDTRGQVRTPAGEECGGVAYCICPNGRHQRRRHGQPRHTVFGLKERRE